MILNFTTVFVDKAKSLAYVTHERVLVGNDQKELADETDTMLI